jgi:hypothetical protein
MVSGNHKVLQCVLAALLVCVSVHAGASGDKRPDYAVLFKFISMDDLEQPLVSFGEAELAIDRQRNQENIAFLNGDQSFLNRLNAELPGPGIKWKLEQAHQQLLLVPEKRAAYAALFEQYCKDAVAFLLDYIDAPSPYSRITTFQASEAAVVGSQTGGITAYLVHNIASEYVEKYHFFIDGKEQSGVRIQMRNRVFSGILGSYTSSLKIGTNRQLRFVRDAFTIWQNSAKRPINVFIVPIEETLHILLRPSTETAMIRQIEALPAAGRQDIEAIIDDWLAVEEAVVGGLVHHIMPLLLRRFTGASMEAQLEEAMAARHLHSQYRYLQQGMRSVAGLGVAATVTRYRNHPEYFWGALGRMPVPATADFVPAGGDIPDESS